MADNETAGVLAKVLAEVEKVSTGTHANAAELTDLKVKAALLEGQLAKAQGDIELVQQKANADLEIVKAALAETHGGKSGAEDWANETAKWARGVYSEQRLKTPSTESFKNGAKVADVVKAAANFSTNVGATAGYLLPTLLRPGFVELKDIYGNFYPKVSKFNSPPGQSVTVNDQSANPVALWRGATQSVGMTQEATPRAYNDDTLSPQLLYVYEIISNELITNPSINFAAMSIVQAAKAVNRALEIAMLSAASVPHGGVSTTATAQTTAASATFALVGAFIKECIADNAYASDTTSNCLFLHPRDAITLALQPVGASELTGMLVWGNPREGRPTTLLGYEVIVHPACALSTTYSMMLGDPANVILAEGPSYVMDFSDQIKFVEFATAMRVGNHYDFIVKQATEWHKATVTA